jgi:hypothetical protein
MQEGRKLKGGVNRMVPVLHFQTPAQVSVRYFSASNEFLSEKQGIRKGLE